MDSQRASGLESLSRAVIKRDMPASLAALHGTMKTQLRRRVSTKVLRHKLHRLQDYSLPDRYMAASNFDALRKMSKKENADAACGGEAAAEEEMGCASSEEVWVRRTTPPRQAAQRALTVIMEMNASTRSPQTSTRSGQRFAKKAIAQKVRFTFCCLVQL